MKILFFGDVCGDAGIQAIAETLPKWKKEYEPDLVIANAENAAVPGVKPKLLDRMMESGVDAFTSGDHFRDAGFSAVAEKYPILRPLNLKESHPGKGHMVVETALHKRVLIVNLLGALLVKHKAIDYFDLMDSFLKKEDSDSLDAILVDFHASMTSEEQSLGYDLDGRVSAVVGTHTHVPTTDTRILPNGTAFQSDVGMCGALNSVLGMGIERSKAFIKRYDFDEDIKLPPKQLKQDPPYFCDAVLIDVIDRHKSRSIKRLTTRQ